MNLSEIFSDKIESFIKAANKHALNMILVGGGAVNFHGYQRHSADLDFWIDISEDNLQKLLLVLNDLDYQIEDLPEKVVQGEQNISIKISPVFDLELITKFNPGKTFTEVLNNCETVSKDGISYNVLSFEDLISSKITSERIKDKMDIAELQRIRLSKKRKN